jgi:hypothetical protein
VRLSAGTGQDQVRKIKSYDGNTKIAVLYGTSDQDPDISPIEGLDLLTVPDTSTVYSVFPSHYQFMLWDEANKEFSFINAPNEDGTYIDGPLYSDLHLKNLTVASINGQYINNVVADFNVIIVLPNNSTAPVTLNGLNKYGNYRLMIKPTDNSNGAYTTLDIGRSNIISAAGICNRSLQVPGAQGEKLFGQWLPDSFPQLYYRPAPGGSGSTSYTIRVMTV